MSISSLSFSATLPPFYQTTGYATNFSKTNISASGNLAIATTADPSTNQNVSTVTSSVTSNGVNFISNGASTNGNLITVNYISADAANSGQDSGVSQQLLNTNINGGGVQFSAQSSTTHGGNVQTSYNSFPNKAYTATVQNAAVSSETGNSAENILLRSFSQVGNSISITYQVSNGSLSNNTVLANSQVPEQTPSSGSAGSNLGAGATPNFASHGLKTIGDLLASANGISISQTASSSNASARHVTASILAAALNPSSNITPNNTSSVADFIDASVSAFPTSNANSSLNAFASNAYNNAANDFSNSSGNSSPAAAPQNNSGNYTNSSSASGGSAVSSPSISAGIYNSIASASASTIRGAGLNTIA